jgi:integrase
VPRVKLTARNVATLPAVGDVRTDYMDADLTGFALRVSPSGARTYAVVYRNGDGAQRRFTIGDARRLSLADARDIARRVLADVVKGKDPQDEKLSTRVAARRRREAPTFAALAQRFLDESAGRLRPNTLNAWRWILRSEIAPSLGRLRPDQVRRADVREVIERIASDRPTYANRVFELVRRVFSWAVEKDVLETSPCVGLKKPAPEGKRDRVLSADELRRVWAAAEAEGMIGQAVKLLLLTGTRRDEVLGARWDEFDFDARLWRLPASRSKTAERRTLPLSSGALAVLETLRGTTRSSTWLFPSPRTSGPLRLVAKAQKRLLAQSRTSGWVWHDLRRTVRTRLAEMGVAPHIAQAILGHALPRIEGTYNRYEPVPEMRAALEAWSDRLSSLLAGQTRRAQVIPLARP